MTSLIALMLVLAPMEITVKPNHVLNHIQPTLYGACMEDVNHEVYGGIYAQRIFGESFEEPAPGSVPAGWRRLGGAWGPDGKGIHVKAGSGFKLIRDMPDQADGDVETRLVLWNDFGDNAGLLVRLSDASEGADEFVGYEVSLSARDHRLILGKHRHDFKPLAEAKAPVHPGIWYRLRVHTEGARLRVFLNDEAEPRIDFTDTDQPILKGKVALRTWNSNCSFRDVKINQQPAPLSCAGVGVSRMWDRVLSGTAEADYAVTDDAAHGALCQKITLLKGDGHVGIANRGLNRWGISVRKGHTMDGLLWLRGDASNATVALQSADGSSTYATHKLKVGPSWAKTTFKLTPRADDPTARFVITIDQPGSIWVDQVQLYDAPEDRFEGLMIRKDIAEQMRASGLTFLRYGGTMINAPGYRWKNMIGPRELRPPHAGHWYPASTNGFGIFDFLTYCEKLNVKSAFAINVEETPEDAADLADYLTAPTSNPWGKRRAEDGHPEPYHPEYIEIGNEEAIVQRDPSAVAYQAERFQLLAKAIHGRNPNLKLVCAFWWVPDEVVAMKTIFHAIDGVAAAWDLHFWSDDPNSGKGIDQELAKAEALFKSWNPNTTLKAVVFEENGNRHDLQRALGHASSVNASRRHGGFVLADCAANALQPWKQNDNGWDQGQVFFTPEMAWQMPPAYANRMLADDALPLRVECQGFGDLDVVATKSEDGNTVVLTVVNPSGTEQTAKVHVEGFAAKHVRCMVLAGELSDVNTPGEPKRITPKKVEAKLEAIRFPAHSVTSLRLQR